MITHGGSRVSATPTLLFDDRFSDDRAPGGVIGSTTEQGVTRLGVDSADVLSIDHGQLRIGWFEHAGWGRAAIAYGPFATSRPLLLSVHALNGLTTSQTDPRPEGGRAKVRRILATLPHGRIRQPQLRESMVIGWFSSEPTARPSEAVASVYHRAGIDATGELWFQVGDQRILIARNLQNLPAVYDVAIEDGVASLFAWSYPGAHGFSQPGDDTPLARIELRHPAPPAVYAAVQQVVLGEVKYRVDTRVASIRAEQGRVEQGRVEQGRVEQGSGASSARDGVRWWDPPVGQVVVHDEFDGPSGELGAAPATSPRWSRVMGRGCIDRTGAGAARVRGTIEAPAPGRTAYCVPWDDPAGVEVTTVIVPPGTCRGEGHQGRAGVVFWQDVDNHLVLNHFIDDGSTGVSISAFLRSGGHEVMFEWDAVWSNVAERVAWGVPFELSVVTDGTQFLCRVGGEPVLYRSLTDYRSQAGRLDIGGVGLVTNWEWGDDTGTEFRRFSARSITGAESNRERMVNR